MVEKCKELAVNRLFPAAENGHQSFCDSKNRNKIEREKILFEGRFFF